MRALRWKQPFSFGVFQRRFAPATLRRWNSSPVGNPVFIPDEVDEKMRDTWTKAHWDLWDKLSYEEKLKRDPSLFSSAMVEDGDQSSDHLLDDAWVLTPEKHQGTVIWLHGIGEGVKEARKIFELMAPKNLRIVVPKAPLIPVTALEEKEDRTWFDLEKCTLSDEQDEDHRGLAKSAKKVKVLLDEESQLINSDKIILAGFAQGGALALHAGLQYSLPLCGILSVSGYLALPADYPKIISPAARRVPICAVHGRLDEVVPLAFAKSRYKVLQDAGLNLNLRVEFDLAHNTNEQSLFEIQRWFEDTIAGRSTK